MYYFGGIGVVFSSVFVKVKIYIIDDYENI